LSRAAPAWARRTGIDRPIVDTTGTLTEGRRAFREAIAFSGFDEAQVLQLAASLDQGSEHPLAAAIVAGARERGLQLDQAEEFDSVTGLGVRGRVNGHELALGNSARMRELDIELQGQPDSAEALRKQGATAMFLAIDGRLAGIVAVADPIKESAAATIDALQAAGLRIVMATGDGETTARAVAAELGLDEVHGEVRLQGKAELVQKL